MGAEGWGWAEYVDKTGTPCAYCGAPSTHTLIVEPDEFKQGELHRRGKRVGVCDDHNRQLDEDLPQAVTFRRRAAKGVEQTALDVGDGHGQRRGAIYGNEAA